MALAWPVLVILVALLPGFLFFSALFSSAQLSRDTTPRNVVGNLAAIVCVSIAVHSLLLASVDLAARANFGNRLGLREIDPFLVLSAFQPDVKTSASISRLASNLSENFLRLIFYLLVAGSIAFLAGLALSRKASSSKNTSLPVFLRSWLTHGWVYEVCSRQSGAVPVVTVHVLTPIRHEERVLLYTGVLHSLGVQGDGRLSYLVIKQPGKFYMKLGAKHPITTEPSALLAQESEEGEIPSLLFLEASGISNVFFARFDIQMPPIG